MSGTPHNYRLHNDSSMFRIAYVYGHLEELTKWNNGDVFLRALLKLLICKIIYSQKDIVKQQFGRKVDLEFCIKIIGQVKNNPHVD